MTQPPANPQEQNEGAYESLISLIENSQGRLAPIIAACDDWALRQRMIDRYESEAREANIVPYRVELGREPSVRAALAKLKAENDYLQQGRPAVFTITGAETLLRVTLKPEDEQSELDKFFGYLQWTREGLREFHYPIVLWVTHRILKEMSRRAPDFWSWRKAVLRFATETQYELPPVALPPPQAPPIEPVSSASPLLLEELQAEIQQLESTAPDSPNLATLYEQLGQTYAERVKAGRAANLEAAIAAFQTAIARYEKLDRKSARANALRKLGEFLDSQSRFIDAIALHQQALEIAREIGDRQGEANALNSLSLAYDSLGQYQQAVALLQQSLEIKREVGDRRGEAVALGNLGNAYRSLGQHQQAIDLYQQSLAIKREVGDRYGEAVDLGNLGLAYESFGQHQQAIDLYQQSLEIKREVGDRYGEAITLGNLGNTYRLLGLHQQAIDLYQQSLAIKREIGDRYGEAITLGNLGLAYDLLGQYQQAIDLYQQSLVIKREVGDRLGEATTLFNQAHTLAKLDQHWEGLQKLKQAKQLYTALQLDHKVEECDAAIAKFTQILPAKPHPAASLRDQPLLPDWWKKSLPTSAQHTPRRTHTSVPFWLYILIGLAIVLLIAWLL